MQKEEQKEADRQEAEYEALIKKEEEKQLSLRFRLYRKVLDRARERGFSQTLLSRGPSDKTEEIKDTRFASPRQEQKEENQMSPPQLQNSLGQQAEPLDESGSKLKSDRYS